MWLWHWLEVLEIHHVFGVYEQLYNTSSTSSFVDSTNKFILLNLYSAYCTPFTLFMLIWISYVQAQRRSPVTLGALFHDHLVSILFIFSGVFLVNYVLISSAAVGSGDTLLLTFQDVVELMNQVRVLSVVPTYLLSFVSDMSHPSHILNYLRYCLFFYFSPALKLYSEFFWILSSADIHESCSAACVLNGSSPFEPHRLTVIYYW